MVLSITTYVRNKAVQLLLEYPEDLGLSFSNECIHFRSHLSGLEDNNLPITVLDLYKIFKDPCLCQQFGTLYYIYSGVYRGGGIWAMAHSKMSSSINAF